jgi:competence protein ComFC
VNVYNLIRQALQAFLFPQECALCGNWVCRPDWTPLCLDCKRKLEPQAEPFCPCCGIPVPGVISESALGFCRDCREHRFDFDRARAWGLYEGSLRELIRRFKFGEMTRLARPLGELLQACFQERFAGERVDEILPVPLHRSRRRKRGFDQTELLVRLLSKESGIPWSKCLRRIRSTAPQFGLSFPQRLRNVRGAFTLRRPERIEGKTILLVDDILTTGSTVNEISRLLKRRGRARAVFVLTVARVQKWSSEI